MAPALHASFSTMAAIVPALVRARAAAASWGRRVRARTPAPTAINASGTHSAPPRPRRRARRGTATSNTLRWMRPCSHGSGRSTPIALAAALPARCSASAPTGTTGSSASSNTRRPVWTSGLAGMKGAEWKPTKPGDPIGPPSRAELNAATATAPDATHPASAATHSTAGAARRRRSGHRPGRGATSSAATAATGMNASAIWRMPTASPRASPARITWRNPDERGWRTVAASPQKAASAQRAIHRSGFICSEQRKATGVAHQSATAVMRRTGARPMRAAVIHTPAHERGRASHRITRDGSSARVRSIGQRNHSSPPHPKAVWRSLWVGARKIVRSCRAYSTREPWYMRSSNPATGRDARR